MVNCTLDGDSGRDKSNNKRNFDLNELPIEDNFPGNIV